MLCSCIRGCARSIPNMSATDRCFLGCPKKLNQMNLNIVLHSFCIMLLGSYKKCDGNDGNVGNDGNDGNDGIDGADGKDGRDDIDDADR